MKKLSLTSKFLVFTLLLVFAHLEIISQDAIYVPPSPLSDPTITDYIPTIDGLRYTGTVEFGVGELQSYTYEAVFIRDLDGDCPKLLCFSGYIEKYTETEDSIVVLGYSDPELTIKPVFQLQTSGTDDIAIKTNPSLEETWAYII